MNSAGIASETAHHWIKWKTCDPSTSFDRKEEKKVTERQLIKSKLNYPNYWSADLRQSKNLRGTVYSSSRHCTSCDLLSIDQQTCTSLPKFTKIPRLRRNSGRDSEAGVPYGLKIAKRTSVTHLHGNIYSTDVIDEDIRQGVASNAESHKTISRARQQSLCSAESRRRQSGLSKMVAPDENRRARTPSQENVVMSKFQRYLPDAQKQKTFHASSQGSSSFSCELCRLNNTPKNVYPRSYSCSSCLAAKPIYGSPAMPRRKSSFSICDCCPFPDVNVPESNKILAKNMENFETDLDNAIQPCDIGCCCDGDDTGCNEVQHNPLHFISKFISKKCRQFRTCLRSKSLPRSPVGECTDFERRTGIGFHSVDCNMNENCSLCERVQNEHDNESNWENLLACSCKSKSLIHIDNISLLVNPTPSQRDESIIITCDCCQDIQRSADMGFQDTAMYSSSFDPNFIESFCDQCAFDTKACTDQHCEECGIRREFQSYSLRDPMMVSGETDVGLGPYGYRRSESLVKRQPRASRRRLLRRSKRRRRRRRKNAYTSSKTPTVDRWLDNIAVCLQCVFPRSGADGSSSGGSGSDDEGDEEGGEPEEEYEEHGEEASDNEDSDGGDSGSGSGDDDSMNSAELFDDQVNAVDPRDNNALAGSDDGDGPDSECTDSLTELGTGESEDETDSSDDDDDDSTIDDIDGSLGIGSLQSILICERE